MKSDSSLCERVLDAIARQRMFRAGDRVGVAVSGGADSVALLLLLDDLRTRLGIKLAVLHFNHQLRGAESEADEKFVASLAAHMGVELFVGREDVAATAHANGWNLEDAARRVRYAFFSSIVKADHVKCVAVGHTADDQAETIFARLLRGTGPAGLAAIYPVKDFVVRPLLGIRRGELRVDLIRRGHAWREDSSNQDTTRLRAKLRKEIMPVLERDLQPAVVANLGRLAQMAREDEAFWVAMIGERLQALACWEPSNTQGQGLIAAPPRSENGDNTPSRRRGIRCVDLLAPLPWMVATGETASQEARFAVARRLIRGMIESLRGNCRELTARHVEQVLQLATTNSSGHRTELPGITVERSFEWLWFELARAKGPDRSARNPERATADTTEPGRELGNDSPFTHVIDLGLSGGSAIVVIAEIKRRFCLKVIDWPVPESENITVLDRDLLRPPLVLRNWRPGDSFRPHGRRSVHKLKHFFRVNHVSVDQRATWPVLTSAGSLVWVRGMAVAADVAPGALTRTGLLLIEEKI